MVMPDVGKGHSRGDGVRNGSSVLLLCDRRGLSAVLSAVGEGWWPRIPSGRA